MPLAPASVVPFRDSPRIPEHDALLACPCGVLPRADRRAHGGRATYELSSQCVVVGTYAVLPRINVVRLHGMQFRTSRSPSNPGHPQRFHGTNVPIPCRRIKSDQFLLPPRRRDSSGYSFRRAPVTARKASSGVSAYENSFRSSLSIKPRRTISSNRMT